MPYNDVTYRNRPHLDNLADFVLFTLSQDIKRHYEELQEDWTWENITRSNAVVPDVPEEDYIQRFKEHFENEISYYDELLEVARESYQSELKKDSILRSIGILYHLAMISKQSLNSFSSEIEAKLLHADNPESFRKNIKSRFTELNLKFRQWYSFNKEEAKKFEPNSFEIFNEILKQTGKILSRQLNKKNQKSSDLLDCFQRKGDLEKLVELLEEAEYIKEKDGNLFWVKNENLFPAMAAVCLPLIKLECQSNKRKLHRVWTEYFKHPVKPMIISDTYFKSSDKEAEIFPHKSQFDFIKNHFKLQ